MDLRERVSARLQARSLDRALARGESPESSALLAHRARALLRADTRLELAASLGRLAAGAAPRGALGSRLSASGAATDGARRDLERLAERLQEPGPVSPRGVALAQELLSDGAGPLFWTQSGDDLGARVRLAIAALEPHADEPTRREETR